MPDKYASTGLAGRILVDMKRRAAFIAKCAREQDKISASDTLKTRVQNQLQKLNAACGKGKAAVTWNASNMTKATANDVNLTSAADAVEFSTTTAALYTTAHPTAKASLATYVDGLNFTKV